MEVRVAHRTEKSDSLASTRDSCADGSTWTVSDAPVPLVTRCPDCLQNELAEPSDYDPDTARGRRMGKRRYFRCPTCSGYGVVPAYGKDRLDPYMIPSPKS